MIKLTIEEKVFEVHPSRLELLDAVMRTGSISAACESVGVSYRTALNWLKEIERKAGARIVHSTRGGKTGGKTQLTETGQKLVEQYYSIQSTRRPGFLKSFIEMKMSARNVLTGSVKEVVEGEILSMVDVELESRQEIKSVITTDSLKRLMIKPGDKILVIIKATEALLMKP